MGTLRYLLATSSSLLEKNPAHSVMIGPRTRGLIPLQEGRPFGVDCDACSAVIHYEHSAYLAQLDRLNPYAKQCLFAVVPDVIGDGDATRTQYDWTAPDLGSRYDFPLAYVLQDGCQRHADFPPCQAVFLGGSDAFRQEHGAALIHRARKEGLYVHAGRINSRERMRNLRLLDCNSVDGTYLSFTGKDRGIQAVDGWSAESNAEKFWDADDVDPAGLSPERQAVLSRKRGRNGGRGSAGPESDAPPQRGLWGDAPRRAAKAPTTPARRRAAEPSDHTHLNLTPHNTTADDVDMDTFRLALERRVSIDEAWVLRQAQSAPPGAGTGRATRRPAPPVP